MKGTDVNVCYCRTRGNPGKKYENTRHNMGFLVVDRIAEKCGISVNRMKHRALVGEGRNLPAGEALLVKRPATYLNLERRMGA